MGRLAAEFLVKHVGKKGKLIEVRGVAGNSVDRDRHVAFREALKASGGQYEIVEVVGMWDDATSQKVVADALAVHGKFDGMYTQGGSTGGVRALMDAKHKMIPIAGEGENGFRKLCAKHAKDGLICTSVAQSPGLSAIALKAALSALQGNVMPQYIKVPIPAVTHPNFKAGDNYYPDMTDNFFTANEFPPCNVKITAKEIMSRAEANQ
jgi:ribose transport system substrate-binding protein